MSLDPQREAELNASPDHWVGRLSMTLALCLDKNRTHGESQRLIRRTLAEFMVSPVATEGLRDMLREYQ